MCAAGSENDFAAAPLGALSATAAATATAATAASRLRT
jgi:hypothetical protein